MSHKSIILAAALFLGHSLAQANVGASDKWFAAHFQEHKIACFEAKSQVTYTLSNSKQGIEATARGENRGARFHVDHSSLTENQLKITLVNDIDGPLSQDLLIFDLAQLTALSSGGVSEIPAIDFFSEGYDGTSNKYKLSCKVSE